LTQFIASTWCEMATTVGAQLNLAAQGKGFLAPGGGVSPASEGALLNLRYDPALSILTAAEYEHANLSKLEKDGSVPNGSSLVQLALSRRPCPNAQPEMLVPV
jgi:hypothetical protein